MLRAKQLRRRSSRASDRKLRGFRTRHRPHSRVQSEPTKVYTFGPTFRAENSNTSRHLAEFWMIEPEIAFADLSDNASFAEGLLKYTFVALLKEREEDLAFFDQRIEKGLVAKLEGIVGSEFVHMDYGEAIQVLERSNEDSSSRSNGASTCSRSTSAI
jgi:aspartyl/asparaginyl-tRNA synthetase